MAMSGSAMKSSVIAALAAEFGTELEEINDFTDLSQYTRPIYEDRYWDAVCSGIVSHIQSAANATGTDSGGDSHSLTIT